MNTEIGTLRLTKLKDRDSQQIKQTLKHMFAGIDIAPANIPPSAILIIKKIIDPFPRHFHFTTGIPAANREWEQEIRSKIADYYCKAIHPENGKIPFYAEAVLFKDPAEMYACLALDTISGRLSEYWWWEIIRRKFVPGYDLVSLFSREIQYLPAVVHTLDSWNRVYEVLPHLSIKDTTSLLSLLGTTFGFSSLLAELNVVKEEILESNRKDIYKGSHIPESMIHKLKLFGHNFLDEICSSFPLSLKPEKKLFVILTRLLHKAPGFVIHQKGISRIKEWWKWALLDQGLNRDDDREPGITQTDVKSPMGKKETRDIHQYKEETGSTPEGKKEKIPSGDFKEKPVFSAKDIKKQQPEEQISFQFKKETGIKEKTTLDRQKEKTDSFPLDYQQKDADDKILFQFNKDKEKEESPATGKAKTTGIRQKKKEMIKESAVDDSQDTDMIKDKTSPYFSLPEDGTSSRLCGIFYLINIISNLNLLSCFEKDWELTGQIGAWGLLEILARGIITACSKRISKETAKDPVWHILERLALRDWEYPFDYTIPCRYPDYRVPARWFELINVAGNVQVFWNCDKQRVYAWVDPGFVCFSAAKSGIKNKDDMRRKVPSFAPAREIRVSRTGGVPPLARMTCSLVKYLDRGLKQWLSLVIPYVLIYLHSLFSSGGFEDINIMKSLFCAEGMIYPSSSHLDIVMSINTISLPVRTGGLDRNPGWLPEFSRVVGFHFI